MGPGNLDSSEKFSVGGPYGVRAYAPGSGNGDLGWQASMELRYALRPGWQLSTFVDQGQARLNRQPWTTEKNRVHMSAAGSSLTWGGTNHQIGLTAAWPLAGSGLGSDTDKSPEFGCRRPGTSNPLQLKTCCWKAALMKNKEMNNE